MDQKKPCEWDEQAGASPLTCSPADESNPEPPSYRASSQQFPSPTYSTIINNSLFYSNKIPVKASKSHELRGSLIYRCECIKRNGLQDRCKFLDCMGRPECMTKSYPMCHPGQAALLKLTDIGDSRVALEKFYIADQARESALAAYCRLVCPENNNGTPCYPPLFITPASSVAPHCGSAQSSSNRLQPQCYNTPIHNQTQKRCYSPADSEPQQQLYESHVQRSQQQQPMPQQHCQQQYRQQEPMSYSHPVSQTPPQLHTQLCSPCMLPTYTQC